MLGLPWWAVLVVGLLPGAYAAFEGRKLAARPDDPALAERYLAYQTRVWSTLTIFGLVQGLIAAHAIWFNILVGVLGTLIGMFPARRRVLEETWSLPQYLDHAVRFGFVPTCFWWLALALPMLTGPAGRAWPIVVGLGAAVFVFLSRGFTRLVVAAMRAKPLADESLLAALREVSARSRVPMPEVLVAATPGGRWANAMALPSARGSRVVYGQTLLDALPRDEVVAIYGHEVAHLEHHAETRERRVSEVRFWVIALLSVAASVLAAKVSASFSFWVSLGWMLVWGTLFSTARSGHQAHEADSDRRAVELVGDPEALVRALVRLHALARMPARLALKTEVELTHPSLRRRVQALRAMAGVAPPVSGLVVRGIDGRRWAVLGATELELFDGVPADIGPPDATLETLRARAASRRALAYDALADLRVAAQADGPPRLHVAPKAGAVVELPFSEADVERVQAQLDAVPHQPDVARVGKGWSVFILWPELAGPLVFGMTITGGLDLASGLLLTFVARRGAGPFAMGTAALVEAALKLVSATGGRTEELESGALMGGITAFFGLSMLSAARRRGASEPPFRRGTFALELAIAGAGVVYVVAKLGLARSWPIAHAVAHADPSVCLPFVVLAALVWWRTRARAATAALAVLAAAPLLLGSSFVARTFALDAFAVDGPTVSEVPTSPRWLGARELPGPLQSLRLSPRGTTFSLSVGDDDDDEERRTCNHLFRVAALDGPIHSIEACALVPLDGGAAVTLVDLTPEDEKRHLELRWSGLSGLHPNGTRALPFGYARLSVDAAGGAFRIEAKPPGRGLVALDGSLTDPGGSWSETPLLEGPPPLRGEKRWTEAVRDADGRGLLLLTRPLFERRGLSSLVLGMGLPTVTTELGWRSEAGVVSLGRTARQIDCVEPSWRGEGIFCTAQDDDVTDLWRITGGRLALVGRLPHAWLTIGGQSAGGFVFKRGDERILFFDQRAKKLEVFSVEGHVGDVALAPGVVGVLTRQGDESSKVSLYALAPGAAP